MGKKVEVYCSIWGGHCQGCEVGSGKAMTGRIECTGPDWTTGKHTTFIDPDQPYAKEYIEKHKFIETEEGKENG